MEKLNENELKSIHGGLLKIVTAKVLIKLGIGISFLIGALNGYQNPLQCNNK